jgi:hypothetical protein
MHRLLRIVSWIWLFVLTAMSAHAADCRTTFDNRCLSSPMLTLYTVDCQTTFDARCLPPQATEAEIEANALASQRRIETLLQEQQAEAAWWDAIDQQEAVWRQQAEWDALLFPPAALPPMVVVVRAPLRHTAHRWSDRR